MTQTDIETIMKKLAEIETKLNPISEAYQTSTILGRWLKGVLAFVSVLVGVALGLKALLGK